MDKLTFNRTDFLFQISHKVSLTILRKLFVGLRRDKKENSIGGKQFTGDSIVTYSPSDHPL